MAESNLRLPRVTIQFCTQCKWNLRAAYFAQELLQTFSTSLGEISLQPSTGGVFKVDIYTSFPSASSSSSSSSSSDITIQHTSLWDRKTDGGFPETKELKRRVRDVIEPRRNLGHVDRDYNSRKEPAAEGAADEEQRRETTAAATTGAGAGGKEELETIADKGEESPGGGGADKAEEENAARRTCEDCQ
ncbi:hypothetical protein NKR19_g8049 [Coniochaeta hoffmannii]|uniref:Rdx family-domain-containing protein n=1 Tax=Coniochaeta hoffmannii TaxID=91930 RepID=A0AA38VCI5_9PEZI|nr:hypothetical protein NKR19_g8049 [Coniochaeta hoffmannii]